jgi:hypothetical protein
VSERIRDLSIVAALFAVVIVALSSGYREPVMTTMLLAGVVALTLLAWHSHEDLVLGLTGIVLGPLIEMAAVSSGLWRYASPSILGLPWWVVPMWWIYPVTVNRLIVAVTRTPLSGSSLWFAGALVAIEVPWLCVFGETRPGLALAGTLLLLALFLARHHARVDLVTLLVCGVIGPGAELVPVRMGAWGYPDGPLFGLPWWLPPGYGVFGAALIHVGLALCRQRPARRANPASAHSIESLRQLHDAKAKQRVAGWQP